MRIAEVTRGIHPKDLLWVANAEDEKLDDVITSVFDVESEVAVFLLAQKLGVPCCPAYRVGQDVVFSAFLYDFSTEYLVHFRSLFYEDTEEMAAQAIDGPTKYATGFEYSEELINLDITKGESINILNIAGFTGYRFDGALELILKTLQMVRRLA